jgi:hypothetical protein
MLRGDGLRRHKTLPRFVRFSNVLNVEQHMDLLNKNGRSRALTDSQDEQFLRDGFVKLEHAFSETVAEEARGILWRESRCDPENPATWIHPVVRIGDCAQEVFCHAANTPVLHAAFNHLVGVERWVPRTSLGGFPIRFPHKEDPGDTGWHVDASFPPAGQTASYLEWRINLESKGRALLMLFLFSDVAEQDAPTRIRLGSHLRVAGLLASAGPEGMTFMEVARALEGITSDLRETTATGPAGTVYLCHPFLAHAAQRHRGNRPRFMAQPPLYPKAPVNLARTDEDYSLVERAIINGLH